MERRPAPGHREPGTDPDAVLLPGEVDRMESFGNQGAEVPGPVAGEGRHGIDPEGREPVEEEAFTQGRSPPAPQARL